MKWGWLAAMVLVAGCHHVPPPLEPIAGVNRAYGTLSRDREAFMRVTVLDNVYQGRYALAPKPHTVPENFGGLRSLDKPGLALGGQGNSRATLADYDGLPLYCVFDLEPVTFDGAGECQDSTGRTFDLTVAAGY